MFTSDRRKERFQHGGEGRPCYSRSTRVYGAALGLVLGISVATAQWVLFPAAERRAGRWALASAVALPVAILFCGSALEHALDGLNPVIQMHHPIALDLFVISLARPGNWVEFATQFSAMIASALLVRALMLTPIRHRHAH